MREKIYHIIEPSDGKNIASSVYDYMMIAIIIIGTIPLAFKTQYKAFTIIDIASATIFIIDYLLRWVTADFKYNTKSKTAFLRYPFSFMAIIDLLSILPSFTVLNKTFKLLKLFRLLRALRVFRAFKAFRYSKSLQIISSVLKNSKHSLLAVGTFAVGYVLLSAVIVFNIEPDSFDNFFSAVYWATVSLTTVGYGDIYPVTTLGRIVTMVSSIFGIAIVALPAGIITAGYMKEVENSKQNNISDFHDESENKTY